MPVIKAFSNTVAVLALAAAAVAQTPEPQPSISANVSGRVTARADLAIVFLTTHTSASLAVDALEQNNKKVHEIQARLTALGYTEKQFHFSGNRFSPAGQGVYYPGRERPTGFDVYNNLYVYLDGPEVRDTAALNSKVGTLLDEMSKLGAGPANAPASNSFAGGASVVAFTVKAPTEYEKQAYQKAVEKARPVADGIAQAMKVQITGIASVYTTTFSRAISGMATLLDDLPYEYLSSSPNEVPIRVNVNVRYTYK